MNNELRTLWIVIAYVSVCVIGIVVVAAVSIFGR